MKDIKYDGRLKALLKKLRSKSNDPLSLAEIAKEVNVVRRKRYKINRPLSGEWCNVVVMRNRAHRSKAYLFSSIK
jgi:hypothetical protein